MTFLPDGTIIRDNAENEILPTMMCRCDSCGKEYASSDDFEPFEDALDLDPEDIIPSGRCNCIVAENEEYGSGVFLIQSNWISQFELRQRVAPFIELLDSVAKTTTRHGDNILVPFDKWNEICNLLMGVKA